jgi:type VI secretion system secreted protein Hcp
LNHPSAKLPARLKITIFKAAVGVVLLLGLLGLSFLYRVVNQGSCADPFTTAASAQPSVVILPRQIQTVAAYVKFDGIDGASQDPDREDWINLLSFSQGQYIPSSSFGSGDTRSELVVFEEFTLNKELDKASPKLAEAVAKGTHFRKVEIELTGVLSGSERFTYFAYDLEDVLIASYHIDASTGNPAPTEHLSLDFEKIKVTYSTTDPDGTSGGNVEYAWDVKSNRPL